MWCNHWLQELKSFTYPKPRIGGPYTIWKERSQQIVVYTTVAWVTEVSGNIQVLLSKFKKLFFKWNPLKVQKLPFLYWPLETTDPLHTIKSERCWNLLLLLANVSEKIILKKNLFSVLSIENTKYLQLEVGQQVSLKISEILILVIRKNIFNFCPNYNSV